MATQIEYNISQEQHKMLVEARNNMISACEDYIHSRNNYDDKKTISNKLQERHKKEKILDDLIFQVSNSSGVSKLKLSIDWGIYPIDIENELDDVERADYLHECNGEDPLDCLY